MASNAVTFFAGVGTTFAILTAGFSGGLVFTKAAFDDRAVPSQSGPASAPRVRVVLPAYSEPAPSGASKWEAVQAEASTTKPEVQAAREAPSPVTQVEKTDLRKTVRQSRVEARRQAERKARKIAAARTKHRLEAQPREEPAIMAFGGDGPHSFGN